MNEWRMMLLLLLPGLLGLRDPFQPPEDRCALSQLSLWHYRGMVDGGGQRLGIVQDASGKWRRLLQGQRLGNNWEIAGIGPGYIDIALSTGCEPSQWRWLKEGTTHASTDTTDAVAGGDGKHHRERETRHAGGG